MSEILIDETTGIRFEAVVPGSAEDPFTSGGANVSQPAPTSPVVALDGGAPVTRQVEGIQVQPTQTPAPTAPAPVAPPATPAQVTPTPEPQTKPVEEVDPAVDIDRRVSEAVGKALRAQQSSYDKRMAQLDQQLKEAQEAAKKAERESKLNSEELTDDEKAILRNKYALEDREAQLNEYETELDGYYRSIYVATLVQENSQYGVSAEELEVFSEPEEMDAYVKDKALDFYRSGQTATTTAPTRTVQAPVTATSPESTAPAGASAPTDLGGMGAPPAPAQKWDDGTGPQSLLRNLNALPWQTIPVN